MARFLFWFVYLHTVTLTKMNTFMTVQGIYKIIRTDAVKLIKLTIRPIGRHHPRNSSLPHVHTGPTVSSILERFLEVLFRHSVKHSLRFDPDLLNGRPLSFNFIFGNRKKSQGAKLGEYGGWGMTANFYFARNCWVRTEVWDGASSCWSSQVCSRQSSGRRLRTFSRTRREMSQWNPDFTVWPFWTGASRYHSCL
jgi:hypothetical protein